MQEHIGLGPQEAVFKFLAGIENVELLGTLRGQERRYI